MLLANGLTAAIPMDNPYCSCKLTRVRPSPPQVLLDNGDYSEIGQMGPVLGVCSPAPPLMDFLETFWNYSRLFLRLLENFWRLLDTS